MQHWNLRGKKYFSGETNIFVPAWPRCGPKGGIERGKRKNKADFHLSCEASVSDSQKSEKAKNLGGEKEVARKKV